MLERVALEAKKRMRFTSKENQEIAFDLGFKDPALSRFFRKMTLQSPTEYRETKVASH